MANPSNKDIRAKILEDLYNRRQQGKEILSTPAEYAKLLGISEELATFNIQYLLDAGLVRGQSIGTVGTTKKRSFVTDLTSFGVEAVEGLAGQNLAVNFSIINVNAPVSQSQIAVGSGISQAQSLGVNTLDELDAYLDQHFANNSEAQQLKVLLRELEMQSKRDEVKPTLVGKVRAIVSSLGPAASIVIEFVLKHYLGGG